MKYVYSPDSSYGKYTGQRTVKFKCVKVTTDQSPFRESVSAPDFCQGMYSDQRASGPVTQKVIHLATNKTGHPRQKWYKFVSTLRCESQPAQEPKFIDTRRCKRQPAQELKFHRHAQVHPRQHTQVQIRQHAQV